MISKSTGLTLLEAHNFNHWAAKNPDQLLLTITPFSKLPFWIGNDFLVQSGAQKWSTLQKIVLMRWSFWQEMSDIYFSLENDQKGVPLDDFFHFLAAKNFTILLLICFFCHLKFRFPNKFSPVWRWEMKKQELKIKMNKLGLSCAKLRAS